MVDLTLSALMSTFQVKFQCVTFLCVAGKDTFNACFVPSLICIFSISETSNIKIVSVAVQAGLSLTWLKHQRQIFLWHC